MSIYPSSVTVNPLQTPKIKFFKQRDAGDRITATLDFLRQNRTVWLRMCAWIIIPFCLVLGWLDTLPHNTVYLFGMTDEVNLLEMLMGFSLRGEPLFSLAMVMVAAVFLILYTATGTMMYLYENDARRLDAIPWSEVRAALGRQWPFGLIMSLTVTSVFYLISQLGAFWQLVLLLVTLPMALMAPVGQIWQKDRVSRAYSSETHALHLGFKYWGALLMTTAGLMFIMLFLRGASHTLGEVLVVWLSNLIDKNGLSPLLMQVIRAFLSALEFWVAFLCLSVLLFGAGYMYGSAEEKESLISLDDDVRNFENL